MGRTLLAVVALMCSFFGLFLLQLPRARPTTLPTPIPRSACDSPLKLIEDAAIINPVLFALDSSADVGSMLSSLRDAQSGGSQPFPTSFRLRRYAYYSVPLASPRIAQVSWQPDCPVAEQFEYEVKIPSSALPTGAQLRLCTRKDLEMLQGYWTLKSGRVADYTPFSCRLHFTKLRDTELVLLMFGDSNTRTIFGHLCASLGFKVIMAPQKQSGECHGERLVVLWSSFWINSVAKTLNGTACPFGQFPEAHEVCNKTCRLFSKSSHKHVVYVSFGSHSPYLTASEISTILGLTTFGTSNAVIIGLTTAVKLDLIPDQFWAQDAGLRTNDRIRAANRLYSSALSQHVVLDLWHSSLALSVAGHMSDAVHFHSDPAAYEWWAKLLSFAIQTL